jgi:hypothetical protein
MSDKFTRFLSGVGQGITNPKGNLGDFRHASRLFVNRVFELAPRTKFSFYVYFDIDKRAVQAPAFAEKHILEAGMLVKSADLPRFTFDTVTKNQYNRKKIIYRNINYDPITITLHDDNLGVTNALWALYYGYYSRDRHNEISAYGNSPYSVRNDYVDNDIRYGLDNDRKEIPFLKSISIYTMAKKRFNSYTLVNPVITSWNHGNVDHYQNNATNESSMSVAYEAVLYGTGRVSKDNPEGFATIHYDNTPSSLSIFGGGTSTLFGPGGVISGVSELFGGRGDFVSGAEQIFGEIQVKKAFDSPADFLRNTAAAINLYRNIRNIANNPELLAQEATNILSTPGQITNVVSGVAGSIFPKFTSNDPGNSTVASQKNP